MPQRYQRLDFVDLKAPVTTPEGYLRLDGKIARTGIQTYKRADGTEVREFRPPTEVFAAAYVDSFQAIPLTNNHPAHLLTDRSAKTHAIGAVSLARKVDEKWLGATMAVWDAAAIDDIRSGRSQLSVGYSCEVVEEAGEWEGQRYDAVQKSIVANHLALCDAARAGADARLRLDAANNVAVFVSPEPPVIASTASQGDPQMPHSLKIDGFSFEVTDANAQTIVDRALERAKKDAEDKATAADAARAAALKELGEAKAKIDAMEAQHKADAGKKVECDECDGTGKVDGEECDACDGKGEYAAREDSQERRDASLARRIDRGVRNRTALVVAAAAHLGKNEKLDGKSDLDIRKLVIAKLLPAFKLDGRTADEIAIAYDAALAGAPKAGAKPPARSDADREVVVKTDSGDDRPTDAAEARRRQDAKILEINRGGRK